MESALQQALRSEPAKAPYRRAHGASAQQHKDSNIESTPPRPEASSITHMSKSEIAALATPILQLVGDMQLYSVMGASTQVIVVDIDSPLSVAFIAATESRVSSVLLWDGQASVFAGVLTVTDYIRVLLHCHEASSTSDSVANLSVRELLTQTWLKESRRARMADNGSGHHFVWGTPNLSVLDCLTAMLHHKVNRLPILASKHFEEDTLPNDVPMGITPLNPGAPCPPPPSAFSVVAVVTFPQLLAHIGRVLLSMGHTDDTAETLYNVPLQALNVGRHSDSIANGTIPKLSLNDTVSDALHIMLDQAVHAVCILDPNGIIVDVVTRSDVLRMESGGAYDVTLRLADALSWRPAQTHAVVCSLTDSFGDVLSHFVNTWVKEMFVVDPKTDVVVGQLSMKELLEFLFDAMKCA
jgi:CBS domain-containing protein